MKSVKLFLTLFFLTLTILGHSQIVATDSVDNSVIIGSATGMYAGTKSKKAQEYFDKALEYGINRENEKAEKHYLKAIKEDSNFIEAYDNLGRIYRATNQLDKAVEYYTKSIELYPNGVMAHQNLAIVYGLQKKHDKTIAEYKEIIRIEPQNAEGYYGIANTYMVLSKFDEAIEYGEKALKIYEKTESEHLSDGYYLLGLINYYKGDKESAKGYFQVVKDKGNQIHPQLDEEFFGQETKNATYSLETKEDYAKYEQEVVNAYNWLLKTPLGTQASDRKSVNAFLIKWLTGSPNVSIELSDKIVTYLDCGECLTVFMGGWAKYALESRDFKNKFEGNLAGTEGVIEFYLKNKQTLGKNKAIEKLIKMKDKNKLKSFIKSNI